MQHLLIVTTLLAAFASYLIPEISACDESIVVSCLTTDKVFITENLTHIVHSNTSDICRFVIPKEPGICQIKFDFLLSQLGSANAMGDCSPKDVMTIKGSTTVRTMSVCGNLTGQHMFLDFGDGEKIEVDISGRHKHAYYDILVTQLKCNNPNRAPPNCLQYYKEQQGTVQSFNYPYQQLNDQEYTVCIGGISGSERIKWKPCANTNGDAFFISGNLSKGKKTPGPTAGTHCHSDFVQIFGENRQCGSEFLPLTSSAKPYMLHVGFDDNEMPIRLSSPPVVSLPVSNRLDGFNRFGHATPTCPDLSGIGLVCTPPPICDGNDLGARGRPKDIIICTCTFPFVNSDAMNTGFCLEFTQFD